MVNESASIESDLREVVDGLKTPFDAMKSAEQSIQFAIDPSKELTRRRYGWYSNNTLFDATHFTADDSNGTINIQTGATGSDTALLRTALSGQYVSQALAQPGIGLTIPETHVQRSNGLTSLTHGSIAIGAGWHDGSSGGYGVPPVKTFLGRVYRSDGTYAVCISDGSHVGDSPVPQSEWNIDPMDGNGDSGRVLKPENGYVNNWPYTWYAFGALFDAVIDPSEDKPFLTHRFNIEGASLDRPNLSPTVIVDNGGTASSLEARVGGMQYTLYGAVLSEEGGEERGTDVHLYPTGSTASVSTAVSVDADGEIDPNAEPGTPLFAVRRESGVRDLTIRLDNIVAGIDNDIWLYAWDEYDPGTALTGDNFDEPNEPANSSETLVEVDSASTDYTPTTAVSRGIDFVSTSKNQESLDAVATDDRVPIDATRVITAVHDGTDATVNPFEVRVVEGF